MPDVVNLADLPLELRPELSPGTPEFRAYARQLEQANRLPEGTLTRADFRAARGSATDLLLAAAQDAAKSLVPPPAAASAVIPPSRDVAPRATRPFREYDPSEGGYDMPFGQTPWSRTTIRVPQAVARPLAGAGKSLADTGRGLGQWAGLVPQGDVDEAQRLDQALMDTPGGMAGYVGGSAAQSALPFGAAARAAGALSRVAPTAARVLSNPYSRAGLSGGAYSAVQPVESGSSRSGQAAVGALASVAGQGAGEGLKALARPAWAALEPQAQQLARLAEDRFKIPLRAADMTKSAALKVLQPLIDALPGSGGKSAAEKTQKAYNLALARTMGEDSINLNDALRGARGRLRQTYDDLAARNSAELDQAAGTELLNEWKRYRMSDTSQNKQVSRTMDEYLGNMVRDGNATWDPARQAFVMPGATYKEFRSEARSLANRARKDDGKLAAFYDKVKEVLDRGMRTSSTTSPEDAALYKLTDRQYGNMKTLAEVAPKDASGDADFGRLASTMLGKGRDNLYNRNAMIYGPPATNDLVDLAKIGTTFAGRGAPETKWSSYKGFGINAAKAAALPAAAGSLYALNMHDEDPLSETLKEGALLGLGGLGLGRTLSSRWFARGAPAGARALLDRTTDLGLTARGPALGYATAQERASAPHLGPPSSVSGPGELVPYDLLPTGLR